MAGQIVAAGTEPEMLKQLLSFSCAMAWWWSSDWPSWCSLLPRAGGLDDQKLSWKQFQSGMRDAQLTAFSTSSSVATLPVTMQCVHDRLGVSTRTSSFVLPIGATVNMDGTSMYQAIVVVALAQFHMVDLALAKAVIVLTATLASIGAAAVPSAGLVR